MSGGEGPYDDWQPWLEETPEEPTAGPRDYVIWSFEHRGWWGPDERGYVETLDAAGRYTAVEAGRIATGSILGHEVALHESTARINGAPTVPSLWAKDGAR